MNQDVCVDLRAFFAAMDAHQGDKVLVHCAANYRVTAFVGLYCMIREGSSVADAFETMRSAWEPDEVWQRFIADMLQALGADA
jgi:hypothetical protein